MVFLTRGPIQNLNLCEIAQNRYNDAGNRNGLEFILNIVLYALLLTRLFIALLTLKTSFYKRKRRLILIKMSISGG